MAYKARMTIWGLVKMVTDMASDCMYVCVCVCVCIFQKTKFNFSCDHLVLKGTIFFSLCLAPRSIFEKLHNLLGRHDVIL